MKPMSKWERVRAALAKEPVDRPPISLWKHYHLQDRAPGRLAQVTLDLYRQFDMDLIKFTPSGLYFIQDWGATIRFGRDDDTPPLPVEPVIAQPEDWETLHRLDVHNGALARELEAIQHLAAGLNGEAPFLMTLFSPLTVAYKLCGSPVSGQHLMEHMRQAPAKLHAGLATIRDAVIEYADACLEAGAPGFFYATQMATGDLLTREEFLEFGRAYDLPVLEALQGRSQITMLHVCRRNLLFDLVADYPVDVINWAAGDSNVSLADVRAMTDTALAGGLSLDTLLHGSPADVEAEVRGAVAQAGREGFILAPDCVIKGPSPDANLAAARQAVERLT